MSQATDHIVLTHGPDDTMIGLCTQCFATIEWTLPMSIEEWCVRSEAFINAHAGCLNRDVE